MANAWSLAAAAVPAVARLAFGDGSVRQRENNFAQNAENQHWARVERDRMLDSTQKIHVLQNAQMADQYRNQFGWLVEGAQKAGFNPLTALGQASTHGGGAAPAGQTPLTNHVPDPVNKGAVIGDAVGKMIGSMDPIEQERRVLENELMEKRIAQIDNEEKRLGQVPELRQTAGEVRRNGTPIKQEGTPDYVDDFSKADPEFPREAEADLWAAFLNHIAGEDLHTSIEANLTNYRKWLRKNNVLDKRLRNYDAKVDAQMRKGDNETRRKSKARKAARATSSAARIDRDMAGRAQKHKEKYGAYPEWYKRHMGTITRN